MAYMYPKKYFPDIPSEQKVFDVLKGMSDNFHIFHSIKYSNEEDTTKEIDFIIIDVRNGVLFLEVKGGDCKFDEGKFYQINKGKIISKDPQKQANDGLHFFRKRYDEFYSNQGSLSGFKGYFHWGVCTPDKRFDPKDLPASYPEHSFISAEYITDSNSDNLEKRIVYMLKKDLNIVF